MAVEMANEGLITKNEALLRVEPDQITTFLLPHFDEEAYPVAVCLFDRRGKIDRIERLGDDRVGGAVGVDLVHSAPCKAVEVDARGWCRRE